MGTTLVEEPLPLAEGPVVKPKRERLLSLDVYRGVIMALLISNGLGLSVFKGDAQWGFLARHVDHVAWEGCVFWDLIQPAFMFMVGVAMPLSFARRRAEGASYGRLLLHMLTRVLGLLAVGIFLDCVGGAKLQVGFIRVLQQIAIGYFIAFFFVNRSFLTQGIAAAVILIGYTLVWRFSPYNGAGGAWAMGTENVGAAFDRWMLGRTYPGYYVGLNAIPSAATILFGVMCGKLVSSDLPKGKVMLWLLGAGVAGMLLGWLLAGGTPLVDPAWGFKPVPMIKRIWTASFALYAGGITVLFLLGFYALIEVAGLRRGWLPFVVVGANAIFAYCMWSLFRGSFFDRAVVVFWKPLATAIWDWGNVRAVMAEPVRSAWPARMGPWGVISQAFLVLVAEWSVLWFLYRKRIFFKL